MLTTMKHKTFLSWGQRVPVVLVAAEPRSRTLDFKPATDKGGRPAGW